MADFELDEQVAGEGRKGANLDGQSTHDLTGKSNIRNTTMTTPGTMPTTAKLEGSVNMPLLTISAII